MTQIKVYSYAKDDKTQVVYYLVRVSLLGKKWELKKRYKEFDALHAALLEAHGSIPSLPAKTMGMMVSTNDIVLRKEELNQYLKKCIDYFDLFNDEAFVSFLEVPATHPDRQAAACSPNREGREVLPDKALEVRTQRHLFQLRFPVLPLACG